MSDILQLDASAEIWISNMRRKKTFNFKHEKDTSYISLTQIFSPNPFSLLIFTYTFRRVVFSFLKLAKFVLKTNTVNSN